MWTYITFTATVTIFITDITAEQHRYTFEQEKFEVEYLDKATADCTGELYDFNHTKALNFSITLKIVVPDNAKLYVAAMKWTKDHYGAPILQMSRTIKDAFDMTVFDIDNLVLTKFQPPLMWPMKKGVTYQTLGWTPDATKFPPNLPAGKWKVRIAYAYANKTEAVILGWYGKLVYKH